MAALLLTSCSLAPSFHMPDTPVPASFREQPAGAEVKAAQGHWQIAAPMEKSNRGQWWKLFDDEALNNLEAQAAEANPSLKAAMARVQAARAEVRANAATLLPDVDLGGNAVRQKPASAALAAFGQPAQSLKPFNLYSAQGTLSYEVDLFGRVRDTEKALHYDAETQAAMYNSMLLALQADVAQNYFSLRALDSERQLLRATIKIRTEANRIMQKRFDAGEAGEADLARTQSELASTEADLLSLDRRRANLEHALAVLLGKLPSEFMFAESPLSGMPPEIPAGLPSQLLLRRPDITAAVNQMQAANTRIGVARTAFFPTLDLTATGGFESVALHNLFTLPNRFWALGQLAGSEISWNIFNSGRSLAGVDAAHAAYDEAVANYKNQVLVAFRDVEDNLSDQRLLSEQSMQQDAAAAAAQRTTDLTQKRYDQGDISFFEVVNAQRDSLAASRAAIETSGQRFITAVNLIRALGGGWDAPPPGQCLPPDADMQFIASLFSGNTCTAR